MSRGYWKRAKTDTWADIGEPRALIIGTISAVVGAVIYIKAKSVVAAEVDVKDVALSLLSAGTAVVIMGALLFIYNFVCAPYRVERDRADAAEAEVAKLKDNVDMPRAHLQAMARYDGSLSDLTERITTIARLVDRYAMLASASRQHSARVGRAPDNDEIVAIAELIIAEVSLQTPALPTGPIDGLRVYKGWNHELYIFAVPMRVPPKITISNIPNGSHSEVSNVTRISFEVKFWPQQIQVTSYSVEADASL